MHIDRQTFRGMFGELLFLTAIKNSMGVTSAVKQYYISQSVMNELRMSMLIPIIRFIKVDKVIRDASTNKQRR